MFKPGRFYRPGRRMFLILLAAAELRFFLSVLALAVADLCTLKGPGPGGVPGTGVFLRRREGLGFLLRVPALFRAGGGAGLGGFYRATARDGFFRNFNGILEGGGERLWLTSRRVRRLQGKIIGGYLERYFGLKAAEADLEVLSVYGDVRRLGADLAAAAGLGPKAYVSLADLSLCRMVFPGFIALVRLRGALEARGKVREERPGRPPGRLPGWGTWKLKALKKKADAMPRLAGRELREARALMERDLLHRQAGKIRVKRQIRRENIQLNLYLEAVSLVSRGGAEVLEQMEELLFRMEENHEKFMKNHKEAHYGRMGQERGTDGD